MSPPPSRPPRRKDVKSGRVFGCLHPKVKALENRPDERPWRLKPEELESVQPLFVNLPMYVEHDWQTGEPSVGKWIAMSMDKDTGNLMCEGEVSLGSEKGWQTMESIRDGTFKGFSLGVAGYKKFYEDIHQLGLHQLDFFEVSVVGMGDIHNSNIVGSAFLTHDDQLVDVEYDRSQIAVGSAKAATTTTTTSPPSYNNSLLSIIQNTQPAGKTHTERKKMDQTTASHTFQRADPSKASSSSATSGVNPAGVPPPADPNSETIQMTKAEILALQQQANELAAMKKEKAEAEQRELERVEEEKRQERLTVINHMREILSSAGEADRANPILDKYENEAKAGSVSTETLEHGFATAVASLKRQREAAKNIMAHEAELVEENKRLKFEKDNYSILNSTARIGSAAATATASSSTSATTTPTRPGGSANRVSLAAILSASESSPIAPATTGAGPLLTHLVSPEAKTVTTTVSAPVIATASAATSSSSSSSSHTGYQVSDAKHMWGGNVNALIHAKQKDPRLYELFGEFNGSTAVNTRYESEGFQAKLPKIDHTCLPPGTRLDRFKQPA